MKFTHAFAVFALFAFLTTGAFAQGASVYVDIGPCMAMDTDAQRYACYDLLEDQIRAAQTRQTELPVLSIPRNTRQSQEQVQAAPAPQSVEQVVESDSGPESDAVGEFGLEAATTASNREATARVLESDDGAQELVDTITKLDERVLNQWEVTLASGQVWQQINSKRYRLREGMEVRIYASPFGGSFRLSATNLNGFIQVRRIQ